MVERYLSYSRLADEYYDEVRHPTCANFRYASAIVLRTYLPRLLQYGDSVCELGAGRSLLAEVLKDMSRHDIIARLVISDASFDMVSHSLRWTNRGALVECADASDLPHGDEAFNLVVALSGDPYNEEKTWKEVARVLKTGGYYVFTTPSYHWSANYRKITNSEMNSAEFELRNASKMVVPSFILPAEMQKHEMGKVGLWTIAYKIVRLSDIRGQNVSSKLQLGDDSLPVIEAYITRKGDYLSI
jgi:SAM-dependent methyltransferase